MSPQLFQLGAYFGVCGFAVLQLLVRSLTRPGPLQSQLAETCRQLLVSRSEY